MSYIKKPSVVKIDPTVTHLQPDQFDNDDPIQGYPFGTSAMRVTTATGFPETSGDVITSRTTDDTGSQIFIGEKAYIRTFEASAWSSWRELGESGGGGPVEWDDILNKPSQFPPSPHTHDIEDTIGLQAALDDKASAQSVNELQQEVDEHKADIASQDVGKGADMIGLPDPNNLFAATTVRGALEELFQSVSDGKNQLETAITDKGGTVSKTGPIATFDELEDGIRSISADISAGGGELYVSGEEYVDFIEGYSFGFGNQGKGPSYLHLNIQSNGAVRTYVTSEKVDLTNFKAILIEWDLDVSATGGYVGRLNVTSNSNGEEGIVAQMQIEGRTSRRSQILDISNLAGEYYVAVQVRSTGTTSSITFRVYNIIGIREKGG